MPHRKLPLQEASYSIWSKKYQLLDSNGQPVDRTPEETLDRTARVLSSIEQDSKIWYKRFRDALEYCIPAGRILSNAGSEEYKKAVSLINCTVSDTIDDSMDSILTKLHEAGITLKSGCGIGYEFSTLRPRGAYVHGAGATTSGPLSFMDVYDKMCFTVSSAGGRRGAQMATFDVTHPDVLEFIKAKRENGRLRQFNMSLLITDDFIQAVKNNERWNFSWNGSHVGSMPAKVLWDTIMRSTYDYAEPGFLLIDRINHFNNLWFCENMRATNPCTTGETLILTRQGYKRIDSLVGEKVDVWNGVEWSEVTPKVTGRNQRILDIRFSDGSELSCTRYHGFELKDGTEVEAKELQIGDQLVKFDFPVIEGIKKLSTKRAYSQGFYSGDGQKGTRRIWLYESKIDLLKFLYYSTSSCQSNVRQDREMVTLAFSPKQKSYVPSCKYTIKTRLNWLAGLIDSDGSIQDGCIVIWSINRKFLMKVKRLLNTLGCNATVSDMGKGGTQSFSDGKGGYRKYKVQPTYRIIVNKSNVFNLLDLGLNTHRVVISEHAPPNRDASRFVTVTDIMEREHKEDKVYCFNEPLRHRGVFNGVLTAQCGEQPLPPYGACLLGSVNLTKFVSNPFTEEARFDFEHYGAIIGDFTRMLDNVVELANLPLEQQTREILNKRRHGMGFLGLGSTLAMLGIRYGSPDSVTFTEEVSKTLAFSGFRIGAELADEKGEAPVFQMEYPTEVIHRDGYTKGRTLDKYSYNGRDLFLASHYFDSWQGHSEGEEILKMLAKHGSRFSHHSSIAPTGTISLSMGNNCSNGIESSYSFFYTRNVIEEGKKSKKAMPVYAYEFLAYREYLRTRKESVPFDYMDDDTLLANLPDYFVCANSDDLTPKQHVDVQAAAQKWVDSSISKTINVPTNIDFEVFEDVYMYAYEQGLKGCTTFRFNPEAFQGVLVTKDDLQNTTYRFKLDDGSNVDVTGDTMIAYDGEQHTAANLFDALKEGYYGKF